MNLNLPKWYQWPAITVSIVWLYEYLVKYTDLKLPNLTVHFSPFVQGNFFLTIIVILTVITAFLLTCVFLVQRFIKRQKTYKYCPECDSGINIKLPSTYCHCGAKYLDKCPNCNNKIIRDFGRTCSFCGYKFPTKPKTGQEWMA